MMVSFDIPDELVESVMKYIAKQKKPNMPKSGPTVKYLERLKRYKQNCSRNQVIRGLLQRALTKPSAPPIEVTAPPSQPEAV